MKIRWLWLSQPFDQLTGSKRMGMRTPGPGQGNARTLQRPKTMLFGASINSFYLFFFKSFSFSFFLSLTRWELLTLLFAFQATGHRACRRGYAGAAVLRWLLAKQMAQNDRSGSSGFDSIVLLAQIKMFFHKSEEFRFEFFFPMCSVGVFRRCDPRFQRVCL